MKTLRAHIKPKYKKKLSDGATILLDDGQCSIETSSEVAGIQLYFTGKAEITPELPKGWILQGNQKIILIFNMEGGTISNNILFTYKGYMKITNVIIVNKDNRTLSEKISIDNPNWTEQMFDYSIDTTTWEDYKSRSRKGKVTKTKYNLPDYNLPTVKLDKKNNKKIKEPRRKSRGRY